MGCDLGFQFFELKDVCEVGNIQDLLKIERFL